MADLSLRAIDCGFDPRAHGMTCVVPAGTRSVDYTDQHGDDRTVAGTPDVIMAALVAAGYVVEAR